MVGVLRRIHTGKSSESVMWRHSSVLNAFKIAPPKETPYSLIYKWRLQQEHNMKANNGGKGMTDEQVKK